MHCGDFHSCISLCAVKEFGRLGDHKNPDEHGTASILPHEGTLKIILRGATPRLLHSVQFDVHNVMNAMLSSWMLHPVKPELESNPPVETIKLYATLVR